MLHTGVILCCIMIQSNIKCPFCNGESVGQGRRGKNCLYFRRCKSCKKFFNMPQDFVPDHPNSVSKQRLSNRQKIKAYFYPDSMTDKEISNITGISKSSIGRLRVNRENTAKKRRTRLRAIINLNGLEECVEFLTGRYPICPKCGNQARKYRPHTLISSCSRCGKSQKVKRGQVRVAKIPRIMPQQMKKFFELIVSGKPTRKSAAACNISPGTVPIILKVLVEEFGLPRNTT